MEKQLVHVERLWGTAEKTEAYALCWERGCLCSALSEGFCDTVVMCSSSGNSRIAARWRWEGQIPGAAGDG